MSMSSANPDGVPLRKQLLDVLFRRATFPPVSLATDDRIRCWIVQDAIECFAGCEFPESPAPSGNGQRKFQKVVLHEASDGYGPQQLLNDHRNSLARTANSSCAYLGNLRLPPCRSRRSPESRLPILATAVRSGAKRR